MIENLIPNDYPDFNEFGTPPCAESYPDAFFPEEAEDFWDTDPRQLNSRKNGAQYRYEKEAKAICAECPYKIRCAEYAINTPGIVGIWGGTTDRSRRDIRRKRRIKGKVISVEIR